LRRNLAARIFYDIMILKNRTSFEARFFNNMKLDKYLKEYVLGEEMHGLIIGLFGAIAVLSAFLSLAFWIAARLAA